MREDDGAKQRDGVAQETLLPSDDIEDGEEMEEGELEETFEEILRQRAVESLLQRRKQRERRNQWKRVQKQQQQNQGGAQLGTAADAAARSAALPTPSPPVEESSHDPRAKAHVVDELVRKVSELRNEAKRRGIPVDDSRLFNAVAAALADDGAAHPGALAPLASLHASGPPIPGPSAPMPPGPANMPVQFSQESSDPYRASTLAGPPGWGAFPEEGPGVAPVSSLAPPTFDASSHGLPAAAPGAPPREDPEGLMAQLQRTVAQVMGSGGLGPEFPSAAAPADPGYAFPPHSEATFAHSFALPPPPPSNLPTDSFPSGMVQAQNAPFGEHPLDSLPPFGVPPPPGMPVQLLDPRLPPQSGGAHPALDTLPPAPSGSMPHFLPPAPAGMMLPPTLDRGMPGDVLHHGAAASGPTSAHSGALAPIPVQPAPPGFGPPPSTFGSMLPAEIMGTSSETVPFEGTPVSLSFGDEPSFADELARCSSRPLPSPPPGASAEAAGGAQTAAQVSSRPNVRKEETKANQGKMRGTGSGNGAPGAVQKQTAVPGDVDALRSLVRASRRGRTGATDASANAPAVPTSVASQNAPAQPARVEKDATKAKDFEFEDPRMRSCFPQGRLIVRFSEDSDSDSAGFGSASDSDDSSDDDASAKSMWSRVSSHRQSGPATPTGTGAENDVQVFLEGVRRSLIRAASSQGRGKKRSSEEPRETSSATGSLAVPSERTAGDVVDGLPKTSEHASTSSAPQQTQSAEGKAQESTPRKLASIILREQGEPLPPPATTQKPENRKVKEPGDVRDVPQRHVSVDGADKRGSGSSDHAGVALRSVILTNTAANSGERGESSSRKRRLSADATSSMRTRSRDTAKKSHVDHSTGTRGGGSGRGQGAPGSSAPSSSVTAGARGVTMDTDAVAAQSSTDKRADQQAQRSDTVRESASVDNPAPIAPGSSAGAATTTGEVAGTGAKPHAVVKLEGSDRSTKPGSSTGARAPISSSSAPAPSGSDELSSTLKEVRDRVEKSERVVRDIRARSALLERQLRFRTDEAASAMKEEQGLERDVKRLQKELAQAQSKLSQRRHARDTAEKNAERLRKTLRELQQSFSAARAELERDRSRVRILEAERKSQALTALSEQKMAVVSARRKAVSAASSSTGKGKSGEKKARDVSQSGGARESMAPKSDSDADEIAPTSTLENSNRLSVGQLETMEAQSSGSSFLPPRAERFHGVYSGVPIAPIRRARAYGETSRSTPADTDTNEPEGSASLRDEFGVFTADAWSVPSVPASDADGGDAARPGPTSETRSTRPGLLRALTPAELTRRRTGQIAYVSPLLAFNSYMLSPHFRTLNPKCRLAAFVTGTALDPFKIVLTGHEDFVPRKKVGDWIKVKSRALFFQQDLSGNLREAIEAVADLDPAVTHDTVDLLHAEATRQNLGQTLHAYVDAVALRTGARTAQGNPLNNAQPLSKKQAKAARAAGKKNKNKKKTIAEEAAAAAVAAVAAGGAGSSKARINNLCNTLLGRSSLRGMLTSRTKLLRRNILSTSMKTPHELSMEGHSAKPSSFIDDVWYKSTLEAVNAMRRVEAHNAAPDQRLRYYEDPLLNAGLATAQETSGRTELDASFAKAVYSLMHGVFRTVPNAFLQTALVFPAEPLVWAAYLALAAARPVPDRDIAENALHRLQRVRAARPRVAWTAASAAATGPIEHSAARHAADGIGEGEVSEHRVAGVGDGATGRAHAPAAVSGGANALVCGDGGAGTSSAAGGARPVWDEVLGTFEIPVDRIGGVEMFSHVCTLLGVSDLVPLARSSAAAVYVYARDQQRRDRSASAASARILVDEVEAFPRWAESGAFTFALAALSIVTHGEALPYYSSVPTSVSGVPLAGKPADAPADRTGEHFDAEEAVACSAGTKIGEDESKGKGEGKGKDESESHLEGEGDEAARRALESGDPSALDALGAFSALRTRDLFVRFPESTVSHRDAWHPVCSCSSRCGSEAFPSVLAWRGTWPWRGAASEGGLWQVDACSAVCGALASLSSHAGVLAAAAWAVLEPAAAAHAVLAPAVRGEATTAASVAQAHRSNSAKCRDARVAIPVSPLVHAVTAAAASLHALARGRKQDALAWARVAVESAQHTQCLAGRAAALLCGVRARMSDAELEHLLPPNPRPFAVRLRRECEPGGALRHLGAAWSALAVLHAQGGERLIAALLCCRAIPLLRFTERAVVIDTMGALMIRNENHLASAAVIFADLCMDVAASERAKSWTPECITSPPSRKFAENLGFALSNQIDSRSEETAIRLVSAFPTNSLAGTRAMKFIVAIEENTDEDVQF